MRKELDEALVAGAIGVAMAITIAVIVVVLI